MLDDVERTAFAHRIQTRGGIVGAAAGWIIVAGWLVYTWRADELALLVLGVMLAQLFVSLTAIVGLAVGGFIGRVMLTFSIMRH